MSHKLFVKIGDQYEELYAVAVIPNLKTIKKTTVQDSVKKYLELCTSQKCKKNQKVESAFFNKFLTYLKNKDVFDISDVSYQNLLEFQNVLGKTTKASSVNRRFFTIKHFFSMLEKWDMIAFNPCRDIKQKRVTDNRYKTWTDEEFNEFLSECDGIYRSLIEFLWLTGCRPMEARNLTWKDIDYSKKEITLRCGKNAKVSRQFPITEKLSSLLHSIDLKGLLVFRDISNDSLYQYAKHRLNKLNLNHLTIYGLRHSFASRLSANKANVFMIQRLMGHADIKTTSGYVKIERNELIGALELASF